MDDNNIFKYDKQWLILQLIEMLYNKSLISEDLWLEIKKKNIAHFTNT